MTDGSELAEETLDPADDAELRALGHRMLDDMFDRVAGLRRRAPWQAVPKSARMALKAPLPVEGRPADDVYSEFQEQIAPYPLGNDHPRFWAWVIGNGTLVGMLAEMLAAGLNPNVGGAEHAAPYVEAQVIDWCKQLLGFPDEASGLLVSGGSMANLTALAVARSAHADFDVRTIGLGAAGRPLMLYGSAEMHSSIQRSVEMLGFGSNALRVIPVGDDDAIDVAALERAITADLAIGAKPICVIANAGTTNTGAVDPIATIVEMADRYNLWVHVDGAFGALAALAPDLQPLLTGMEHADSIAFDLHKWGYQPIDVGCVLVRDAKKHINAFTLTPDYLEHAARGTAGGDVWFSDYGIELSRSFRALKVWMAFKTHGTAKLGRMVQQNVDQARYLARLVTEAECLELVAPVPLNVVCFRFVAPGLGDAALDALNAALVVRIQEAGIAVPSGTRVHGRYALRCAITNHRSRREDFRVLVEAAASIGRQLIASEAQVP